MKWPKALVALDWIGKHEVPQWERLQNPIQMDQRWNGHTWRLPKTPLVQFAVCPRRSPVNHPLWFDSNGFTPLRSPESQQETWRGARGQGLATSQQKGHARITSEGGTSGALRSSGRTSTRMRGSASPTRRLVGSIWAGQEAEICLKGQPKRSQPFFRASVDACRIS